MTETKNISKRKLTENSLKVNLKELIAKSLSKSSD